MIMTLLNRLLELLNRLLEEFPSYIGTQEYVHGLLVQITGTAIEVALLLILVPFVFKIYRHFRTRHLRSLTQIYFMSVYNKIADIFLDLGSITSFKDAFPILIDELDENPNSKVLKHGLGYDLSHKLLILSRLFSDEEPYRKLVQKKRAGDFERYSSICKECDEDFAMLVGVSDIPRIKEELFKTRQLLYALRKLMDESAKLSVKGGLIATL